MTHPDAYFTIHAPSASDFRDRGSKFIGVLVPCADEGDLKEHITQLKKAHPGSRHVCYGALLGTDPPLERSNDDGEPNGTAGLPILNQLMSAELCNAALLVVRYFGGTKLGKPGLIHAYKEAAKQAIASAAIATQFRTSTLEFSFEYNATGAVMNAINKIDHSKVIEQSFGDRCVVHAAIPRSEVANALTLFDHSNEVSIRILDR